MNKDYRIIVIGFFILFFISGLLIYKDYGPRQDEHNDIAFGIENYNYIIHGENSRWISGAIHGQIHGPILEIILVFASKLSGKLFGLHEELQVQHLRNLIRFILFFLASIAFYKSIIFCFRSWLYGITGVSLLIAYPKTFSQIFQNSMDVGCMSFFMFAGYTMMLFIDKPNPRRAILHALACSLAIDVRIAGLILPFVTVAILSFNIIKDNSAHFKDKMPSVLTYMFFLVIFIILFWPYLWENPIVNFINSLNQNVSFKFFASDPLIFNVSSYLGKLIVINNPPWHFTFGWMLQTIPLPYIFLFFMGVSFILKDCMFERKDFWKKHQWNIVFFILFFLPLVISSIKGTASFSGWRHFFFVFPSFLMICLYAIYRIYNYITQLKGNIKHICSTAVFLLIFVELLTLGVWIIRHHPNEYNYLNTFGQFIEINAPNIEQQVLDHALRVIREREGNDIVSIRVSGLKNLNDPQQEIKKYDKKVVVTEDGYPKYVLIQNRDNATEINKLMQSGYQTIYIIRMPKVSLDAKVSLYTILSKT